jgi:hypothetical protein
LIVRGEGIERANQATEARLVGRLNALAHQHRKKARLPRRTHPHPLCEAVEFRDACGIEAVLCVDEMGENGLRHRILRYAGCGQYATEGGLSARALYLPEEDL